jgi:hypothetical protein
MMLFRRKARDFDRERVAGYSCLYFERYIVPKAEFEQSEWGRHILEDWKEKKNRQSLDEKGDIQAQG